MVIDWFAVELKLMGSLELTVIFSVWLLVLLFPHETREGGIGGTDTVTDQVMVLLVPLSFVAFTFIVCDPEEKLVVKLLLLLL